MRVRLGSPTTRTPATHVAIPSTSNSTHPASRRRQRNAASKVNAPEMKANSPKRTVIRAKLMELNSHNECAPATAKAANAKSREKHPRSAKSHQFLDNARTITTSQTWFYCFEVLKVDAVFWLTKPRDGDHITRRSFGFVCEHLCEICSITFVSRPHM